MTVYIVPVSEQLNTGFYQMIKSIVLLDRSPCLGNLTCIHIAVKCFEQDLS